MNVDRKFLIFLVSIPLIALLIIYAVSRIDMEVPLSDEEKKSLAITVVNVPQIVQRQPVVVTSDLITNPIAIARTSVKGFPGVPLARISPPNSAVATRVSFIMINEKRKIAIIDGKFLHEGDMIDRQKVAKIEKGRVLLKNGKGETWLTLN
jgi:hypothetical protein